MSVLFVAIPVALLLGGSATVAYIFSILKGQFDDLESPAFRILIDDRANCRKSSLKTLNDHDSNDLNA